MLKVLICCLLFSLAFGQFSSLTKSSTGNIYIFDLFAGALAIFGLFYSFSKSKLYLPKSFFLLLGFLAVGSISLINAFFVLPTYEAVPSFLYFIRFFTYLLSALFILNFVNQSHKNLLFFVRLIVISSLIVFVGGIVQLAIFPDLGQLNPELGWDPHKNRMVSTFFDPNFLGAYFLTCGVLVYSYFLQYKKSEGSQKQSNGFFGLNETADVSSKLLILFISCMVIGVVLTFSRSALGMLSIMVLLYGFFVNKKMLLLSLALMFSAYFFIPRIQTRISGVTDPQDSAYFRLISWNNTLKIFYDNFLFGTGYNTFRYYQKQYGFINVDQLASNSSAGSDSSLLFVLATTGTLGFGFYLGAVLRSLFLLIKQKNTLSVFFLIGLLFHSQFVNSLFYPQILLFFLIELMRADFVLGD